MIVVLRRVAASGIGMTAATNFANVGLGVASGVMTARGMGPHDRGILIAFVLWIGTFASLAVAGQDEALIQRARGDVARASGLAARLTTSSLFQVLVLQLALFAVLVTIAVNSWGVTAASLLMLLVASAIVPLTAVTLLQMGALRAAERLREWNLIRLIPQVAYVGGLTALVWVGELTVTSGLVALFAGGVVTTVLAVRRGRLLERSEVDSSDVRTTKRFGLSLLVATIPYFLLLRAEQLLLGIAVSPGVLGVYAVAASVAVIVQVLGTTLDQVLFPRYSRKRTDIKSVQRMSGFAMAGGVVVALLLIAIAPDLIRFVYGADYIGAVEPLHWLLAAAVVRIGGSVLRSAVKASGRVRGLTGANVAGLATVLALFWPLVHHLDIKGAAAAALAGALVEVATLMIVARGVLIRQSGA